MQVKEMLSVLCLKSLIGAMAITAVVGVAIPPSHAIEALPRQVHFQAIARELLSGIGSANLADIPAIGGYGRPRVALLPFAADQDAVPVWVAQDLNARLMAELTRQGNRSYRLVARDGLKSIIRDIDGIGELHGDRNTRVSDLLRNAQVDILVVGKLRAAPNGVILSYKAVSVEDGTVFAATRPRKVLLRQPGRPYAQARLNVEDGIREATARFMTALDSAGRVSVKTIRRLPDRKITPLGIYLSNRIADEIRRRSHRRSGLTAPITVVRGDGGDTSGARLEGSYWEFGQAVEIRLALIRPGARTLVWRDRILAATLPASIAPAPELRSRGAPVIAVKVTPTAPIAVAGRSRPTVADTQRRLATLGYDAGPADGVLTARTRNALRAFQRDRALPVTGRMTRQVVERLSHATR
ncbi:MAG: peptidoglycan-binding domain-containing protein [Alphaproteobacteria bacterium]